MNMAVWVEQFREFFDNPIAKAVLAFLLTLIGWWSRRVYEWIRWRRREFLDIVNASLTSIHDGKMTLRTLFEKRLTDVVLSVTAEQRVRKAADQTTVENPVILLDRDDAWYVLNTVLNSLAEQFAEGTIRKELGGATQSDRFVFALTRERAGNIRIHKIRVVIVKKSLLQNLPEQMPEMESPNHVTRFETMQQMARLMKTRPEQFLEVELSV